ncbi:hypothetical protein K437DRAFT_224121 [Tilletiaria anomala UBC 951]|uniref:Uncharacterized protein n=1 Tax=Tilletiaria anomala (strain ATCC 24038 / CBS 436.72 / UBC 951) TaxID=1037660 RepID=A0A066VZL4_TILAU|nr:uncharacterized protein K437DRAFT_224121 [Tilletiaria anomala UBC 951]KDN45733.1 hypothetical protein K437DRAFT_224121 [Tilletiaria anomala UBC 951]
MTSQSEIKRIFFGVMQQYEKAITTGDAFFYPSEVHVLHESSTGLQVPWILRNVPSLLEKPTPNAKRDETGLQQNKSDPFLPPYVPNLLVKECDEGVILLNKFCVVPKHFLLITKDFVPQDLPPPPPLLSLAYRIVTAHPMSDDSEMLAFFNCGWDSGASQKHCHLQCIEVRKDDMQQNANATGTDEHDEDGLIPIEKLLNKIEKDGKEHDGVYALPVPWQHFVALLDAGQAKKAGTTEQYVTNKLMGLLDAMIQAKYALSSAAIESSGKDQTERQDGGLMGSGRTPSFNLLVTRRAMHFIPRRTEEYKLEGEWPVVNGKQLGVMSINAMGFAGMLLAKHASEVEAIQRMPRGVAAILSHVGLPPAPEMSNHI